MKKILFIFIVTIMFCGKVSAATIEEQLTSLKADISDLQTQVSNLESQRLNKTYPVGSIYITTTYTTASQVASALGGTWEVYGSGKTLVGVNTSDSNFNTVNKTGGSSTTTLVTGNLPTHTHSIPALTGSTGSAGAHTHSIPALTGSTDSAGAHTHFSKTVGITDKNHYTKWDFKLEELWNGISNSSSALDVYGYGTLTSNSAGAHTHEVTTEESTSGSNGAHTHTVTTTASTSGSTGSGTSFTNLQPYITVYMYKRTA